MSSTPSGVMINRSSRALPQKTPTAKRRTMLHSQLRVHLFVIRAQVDDCFKPQALEEWVVDFAWHARPVKSLLYKAEADGREEHDEFPRQGAEWREGLEPTEPRNKSSCAQTWPQLINSKQRSHLSSGVDRAFHVEVNFYRSTAVAVQFC